MNNPHLVLLFILGTLLITGFSLVIIFSLVIQKQRQFRTRLSEQKLAFEYQQALLKSRLEVQESTLNAVARELHDGVNTVLTGGVLQIRAAEEYIESSLGKDVLDEALESINSGINAIRDLSHSMHAGVISDIGLAEALRRELYRITKYTDLEFTLSIAGRLEPIEEHQILLYRAAQEVFQNIVKHASAERIQVNIDGTPNYYFLSIEDDGRGFDLEKVPAASFGLRSIKERLALANGKSDVQSRVGQGTRVTLRIPSDS